jgi:hypothetical protein
VLRYRETTRNRGIPRYRDPPSISHKPTSGNETRRGNANHATLPAARRGPWANMLDRRLQLYLVGDNLCHHTHDHDQVSTDSYHTACPLHCLPPATHAAHVTSLTNLRAGPRFLLAATARITRRRVSTQTMPSGARARTRSLSTPATTRPSRRALLHSAPSLASRTMVA